MKKLYNLQDEIVSRVVNISKRVNVNNETLALEVIKEICKGGSFIESPHTLRYMKNDFQYSDLGNHEIFQEWLKKRWIRCKKTSIRNS